MTEMTVAQLRPGQAFRVDLGASGHLDYRLIYANNCRAHVEPLERGKKSIVASDGSVLAEFCLPGGKVNIAPGTVCLPIGGLMDELDEMLGTDTAAPSSAREKHGSYDIFHAPRVGMPPMRPNTKRDQMLKLILAGTDSVTKLMAHFAMKRTLVLAHVWEMWNTNGWGYGVSGDKIVVTAPPVEDDGLGDLL